MGRKGRKGRTAKTGGKGREADQPSPIVAGEGWRRVRAAQPFIVLTGLSGSGKSQAIRALEDLGYFCVDNLPTTLIPTLAKLSLRGGSDIEKVAIVVDVREGDFLSQFPKIFKRLRKHAAAEPGADLPRGQPRGARAPLQRDAPSASARAGSLGHAKGSATSARA